ncbi:MAG: sulfotransferase [Devosia sp.]
MAPVRRNAEALLAEGDRLMAQKRPADAVETYRLLVKLTPNDARNLARLGDALTIVGDLAEAAATYKRALVTAPKVGALHRNLANVALMLGDLDTGRDALRTAIRLAPDDMSLHRQLSASTPHKIANDPDIAAMEAALARPLPKPERMQLAFGLGKAYDDIGDYTRALDEFLLGNRLRRESFKYSSTDDDARFARIADTFTADFIGANNGRGDPSNRPIFIIGMPRSGTTLLEQVLASVPRTYAAGELDDMRSAARQVTGADPYRKPEALKPGADFGKVGRTYLSLLPRASARSLHVVDKMPQNFLVAGLIHLALPNARIIHLTRDPADNCLSIFRVFFATEGHPYAYDLGELGHYHNLYRQLMRHWHSVMPGVIHDVSYEQLTAEPERVTRELFAYLGFEWTPDVIETHTAKREVKTASLLQVREPIHTRSVNTAARYGERLKPLLEALAKGD